MAINDFKGLNRLDRMQGSRFGTSSSLRPNAVSGVVGQQYRRQQEDYNTAMRLLRRQARRGDVDSALGALDLRGEANAIGIAPGGIRSREGMDSAIFGREKALERAALDNERTAEINRVRAREAAFGGRPTGIVPLTSTAPGASANDDAPVNTGPSGSEPPTMSSPTDSTPTAFSSRPMWSGGAGTWQDKPVIPGASEQNWSSRSAGPPAPSPPPPAQGLGARLAQGRRPGEGMINGKPASYWSGQLEKKDKELDALAESVAQKKVEESAKAWQSQQEIRNAPKATPVDEQAEYLDAIESYQKGLVNGGDIEGPLKRANEIYRTSNSLGQAKMVGALLRRASKIGNP